MKRWVTVGVLAMLLAALVLANRGLGAWHFVASGAPADVLLAESFDAPWPGWAQFNDGRLSAQMTEGALVLRVDSPASGVFSTYPAHFADFDLRAELRAVDGPIDNAYGVIFRVQDNDNDRLADDSYYLFTISSDGYYRVTRVLNGHETVLSNWIPSPLIDQGLDADNHIRVLATGNTFRFFINESPVQVCVPDDPAGISTYAMDTCFQGQMLDVLTDDAIASGQVGGAAITTQSGGPGVVVQLESLVLLAPESGA